MPMMEHALEAKLRDMLGQDCDVHVEGVGQELSPVRVVVKHLGHEHVVKSTMSMGELMAHVMDACKHDEVVMDDVVPEEDAE